MAAETELQGKIVFSAETSAVKREVPKAAEEASKEVAKKTKDGATKGLSEAARRGFGESFAQSLADKMRAAFTSLISRFGPIGESLGTAIKSALDTKIPAPRLSASVSPPAPSGRIQTLPDGLRRLPTPTVSAPPGVASVVSGAGGALGGVAVAVGGVALVATAAVGLVKAFISITQRVVAFGRGLSEFSGLMAVAFARFDIQMMLIKKRIGDALAPAMDALLNSILQLTRDAMPEIIAGFKLLIGAIRVTLGQIGAVLRLSGIGELGGERRGVNTNPEGGTLDMFRSVMRSALGLQTFGNSGAAAAQTQLARAIEDNTDVQKAVLAAMQRGENDMFLGPLQEFLNRKDGEQAREEKRISDARRERTKAPVSLESVNLNPVP